MILKASALSLATLLLICNSSTGCRIEVCRRRRDVVQGREVLLDLQGCSGRTKPWVRQVSYCLGRSTAEVALKMKDWYAETYNECSLNCDMVRSGTKEEKDINTCINCFKDALIGADFMLYENVSIAEIYTCVDDYVQASLSNELPVFQATSNSEGTITLPNVRPQNDWWSLTVRLPCKPPMFQFWNANCINSFAGDVRARDYVLAQNRLIHSDNIMFLATFNDACRFDINDVEIVWRESVPAFAAPQLSSFPSSFPPRRQERGNLFFDRLAFAQLQETDSPPVTEGRKPRRRKRGVEREAMREIGVAMPCEISSFQITDNSGNPFKVLTKGSRHLIRPSLFFNRSPIYSPTELANLNFTLDFGYDKTGCIFGSSEPKVIVNPPSDWLDGEGRVTCYTCRGASSERNCRKYGLKRKCLEGEICQSQVRQITSDKVSITKVCKQKSACQNNWKNNNRLQCSPGKAGSVCRCCCSENRCNRDALQCT